MENLYQYRDKVNGQWISAPVDGKKIHELVTRGNLTSNDFVREAKQMIRDAFPKSEEHWGMLRKIRIQLNRLWEAQLDDIMAIISSGHHPRIQFREAENSLNKFRDSFSLKKIKDEIRRVWDNETQSSFVQNEIKHRKLSNDPVEFVDLGRDEEEEEILSLSNFEKKFQNLKQKLVSRNAWKKEVFMFFGLVTRSHMWEKQKQLLVRDLNNTTVNKGNYVQMTKAEVKKDFFMMLPKWNCIS